MKQVLFKLVDGSPVYKGDILWHPDEHNVGWYCIAEFSPNHWDDANIVTVRSPNGAVPSVLIADLRRQPPQVRRCKLCGQIIAERGID